MTGLSTCSTNCRKTATATRSPSNSAYDYHTKRKLYLASGIPEFWIVSPEARTFSRWRNASEDGELLTTRLEWQPIGMPEPLIIDIPEFFDDAFG